MTAQPTRPRARLLGTLGLSLSALLSPSGKIISSAAAATVLVGGVVTLLPPPAPPAVQAPTPTSVAPARLAHRGAFTPEVTYIEVDGAPLPVVLTDNPTGGNRSVGGGLASASPVLGLSGGGKPMPGMGSPRTGLRRGAPTLPSSRPSTSEVSPQSGGPIAGNPPPPAGPRMPESPKPLDPPLTEKPSCTAAAASAPDSESPNASQPGARPCTSLAGPADPGGDANPSEASAPTSQDKPQNERLGASPGTVPDLPQEGAQDGTLPGSTNLVGSNDPAGDNDPSEAGAPTPPQGEPQNEQPKPFLGTLPNPFEAPESQLPPGPDDALDPILTSALPGSQRTPGVDDPLNPPILPSALPEPLPTGPSAGQPSSQTAIGAAVPEPSMIGLMLLGLAALACSGRPQPAPARRA